MTQEDIYDEKLSPLVKQIIEICKEHNMSCLLSFACPGDEAGEDVMCTTAILEDHRIGTKESFATSFWVLFRP